LQLPLSAYLKYQTINNQGNWIIRCTVHFQSWWSIGLGDKENGGSKIIDVLDNWIIFFIVGAFVVDEGEGEYVKSI